MLRVSLYHVALQTAKKGTHSVRLSNKANLASISMKHSVHCLSFLQITWQEQGHAAKLTIQLTRLGSTLDQLDSCPGVIVDRLHPVQLADVL